MQDRPRLIDEKIIAAWSASQEAHDTRLRRVGWWCAALALMLIVAAIMRVLPPIAAFATFLVVGIHVWLWTNSKRRCPGCGQIPNGSRMQIHAVKPDFCMHCYQWLVRPLGHKPTQD